MQGRRNGAETPFEEQITRPVKVLRVPIANDDGPEDLDRTLTSTPAPLGPRSARAG